jgi:hypothetical protein
MIWNAIKSQVCSLTPHDASYEAYLTKKTLTIVVDGKPVTRHWVIGPCTGLQTLATDLRTKPAARSSFERACYGRRHTDVPPGSEQPSGGFREPMKTAVPHAVNPALIAQRQGLQPDQTPRRSDLFDVFRDFYAKKTLEAHHVVEKSILGKFGRNKGDLRNDVAPCVLVTAELHQQLCTPEVARFRTAFKPGMSSVEQADLLTKIYTDLYAAPEMAALLDIAKIIIARVRVGQPS